MREGFLPQAPVLPDITTFEPDAAQRESQGMVLGFPCQVSFSAKWMFSFYYMLQAVVHHPVFSAFFLSRDFIEFPRGPAELVGSWDYWTVVRHWWEDSFTCWTECHYCKLPRFFETFFC